MSFFISDDIKDRINEKDLSINLTEKWDAFVVASGKAYKIIEYTTNDPGAVVKLEVAGSDLFKFVDDKFYIDYVEISGTQMKIKSQILKKFYVVDGTSKYITENYLCGL